jgi:hypothetical protein
LQGEKVNGMTARAEPVSFSTENDRFFDGRGMGANNGRGGKKRELKADFTGESWFSLLKKAPANSRGGFF